MTVIHAFNKLASELAEQAVLYYQDPANIHPLFVVGSLVSVPAGRQIIDVYDKVELAFIVDDSDLILEESVPKGTVEELETWFKSHMKEVPLKVIVDECY